MTQALKTPSVSLVNLKGGVGKTALTVNLAFALAEWHQKSVLVIDVDPQFNSTQHLLSEDVIVKELKGKTVKNILDPDQSAVSVGQKPRKGAGKSDATSFIRNIETTDGNLDLLPSLLDLSFVNRNPSGKEGRLEKFLHKVDDDYDIILIDCPPTISVLSLAAFHSSRYYLVPVTPDYFAPIGIPLIEEEVAHYLENLRAETGEMNPLGIVFTIVDTRWHANWSAIKTRVSRATEIPIFDTHFSYSKLWRDCAHEHNPVYRDKPTSSPARQLRDFAQEFLDRLETAEQARKG